ncbi:hypothetical protein V6R21_15680 [Limibacter armeniacum]|uniref:hypothetical protein n=1 Tax=Limibacter armeniacum TaxID=466084 RepID=UPI002FE5EF0B
MKKIVLASVLKPVDDCRMYEKFALTLAEEHQVYVLGYKASDSTFKPAHHRIQHIELFDFAYKESARSKASKELLSQLRVIAPDIIIIHTIELLPAAVIHKMKHPQVKLLYDVQENYIYNFLYQPIHKGVWKYLLATGAMVTELLAAPFIKHYLLAEKTYLKERKYPSYKCVFLENKFKKPHQELSHVVKQGHKIQLLICGTLSTVFGTKEAVLFAIKLHEYNADIMLTISGKCVEPELAEWLKKTAKTYSFISMDNIDALSAHTDIIMAMIRADFVLLPYQPNQSTKNCIPTKLYECLAMAKPMVIQSNPLWEQVCKPHQAAVFIDYRNYDPEVVLHKMQSQEYYPEGEVYEAFWDTEAPKLLKVMSDMP